MSVMEVDLVGKRNKGWSTHNDRVRRQTYPADADPETVEIAEYYRLRYSRARIVKALSYGVRVPAGDMAEITGIPRPLLAHEVQETARVLGFTLTVGKGREGKTAWFHLGDDYFCAEIRGVIRSSWHLLASVA